MFLDVIEIITYRISVPIGAGTMLRYSHTEACHTSKLIFRAQIELLGLTLVASWTRCVQLQ